jgi:glucose-6-phosphate isomerase
MMAFADAVRSGRDKGATGKPFKAIVHIGIGGSDLGPRLLWDALRPLEPQIDLRFVANIDPRDMAEALAGWIPKTTLVVVVSKTFTTQETLPTPTRPRPGWPRPGRSRREQAFGGVSPRRTRPRPSAAARPSASATGSAAAIRCGRRSACRCAVALGWDVFRGLLDGAAAMDAHFREPRWRRTPRCSGPGPDLQRRRPGPPARTVVPYAHRLRRLPAFLQQLEMESNGKR